MTRIFPFEGGPWDGQNKEVRGNPMRLYAAEVAGFDCAPLSSPDPRKPSGRKRHVYALVEGCTYVYQGVE